MVRMTVFPLVFGGCLMVFGWAFYYRRNLICDVEEAKLQRQAESFQKSQELKEKVEEGLKKIRESRKAEEKTNKVRLYCSAF